MSMKTSVMFINQTPFKNIDSIHVSYDHHNLKNAGGLDQATLERGYPRYAQRSNASHLGILERMGLIDPNSTAVVETLRNVVNNARCLIHSSTHGLCAQHNERPAESERPYYGMIVRGDGSVHAKCVDFRAESPGGEYFITGKPVAWDWQLTPLEIFCAEASDGPHIWQFERGGSLAREHSKVFERYRRAPQKEAADAIMDVAGHLPREENYLHHAIGVSDDALFSIIGVGSLEHIGQLALDAGAKAAIVFDNGGSVSFGLRRPGQPLRHLYESWYYRSPSIAVLAYQIASDPSGHVPVAARLSSH